MNFENNLNQLMIFLNIVLHKNPFSYFTRFKKHNFLIINSIENKNVEMKQKIKIDK